ncbi:MAG TPA: hydroxysqualene dehydroxylase HpnE [Burkholderiaceae bacterium]|nr:hydroxysqualene dehydroxylase HpnE [Burkholderiaceae bacterium]
MSQVRRVAVIGAGWAGCAAAVELTRRHHQVTVFEAGRIPGGRARAVEINGHTLDNGQHILLGAYRDTLHLMRSVGLDPRRALLRLPLQIRYPAGGDGMDFAAARLPAPLHLLAALWRSKGLARQDKLALTRFSTTTRWMNWRLNDDCSVAELLQRFDQTARLVRLLWQPLCVAALNTPIERASAQVFLAVLRDSLGSRRAASDMLIPRLNLSALLPQPALDFIIRRGGVVKLGTAVKGISADRGQWSLQTGDAPDRFDAVIVATAPAAAAGLLQGVADIEAIATLSHEPITTCYLQYAPGMRLERPFFALEEDVAAARFGQFVFDRGQLDTSQSGMLAVVISASTEAIAAGHDMLATTVAQQLADAFHLPALGRPSWSQVITEKRAGFSCQPGLLRPANQTSAAGLLLAGDYTAGEYPATIEGAVRSGRAAAHLI